MPIDFDLLHVEKKGRGSGRTFDTLVSAIQALDFNDTTAFVVEWPTDCAEIRQLIPSICFDLGFEIQRYYRAHSCWYINDKRLFVIPFADLSRLSGLDCPIFLDHKILERPTKPFGFSFEIGGGTAAEIIEKLASRSHLDDAVIHIRNGVPTASFNRQACSLLEALESAEYDIEQAGCTVAKLVLSSMEFRGRGGRS